MKQAHITTVDAVAAVLACEIEAGVFEQHVAPALEVARKVAAEQAQQAKPVAWLKYPRKKPELMQVSLSEHLPVALKNSGWVSKPLYAQPPAVVAQQEETPPC